MKQKLPQLQVETTVLFPKYFRFITEHTFTESQGHIIKVVLVSTISLILIILICLQAFVLWDAIKQQEELLQEKKQLQNEITYWEGVSSKYQGYRDVLYRVAALQYREGDIGEAQKYIKEALKLDPNFSEGKVLGARIGL